MDLIRPITITDAMLTSSTVPEADYTEYAAGTTYATGNYCMVTSAGTHDIYKSLKDSNIGNYPPDNTTGTSPYWLYVSKTNRWKVFDDKVGSQTSQANAINYVITPGVFIDRIVVENAEAATVNVTITDSIDGEVYNETVNMIRTDNVYDYISYCTEDIIMKTDVIFSNLPMYLNAAISITLTYTGGTALVGSIIIGKRFYLGAMQYSPSLGITSYSTKEADSFGNYSIVKRPSSRKLRCITNIENTMLDETAHQLALYDGVRAVYVGSDDYACMIIDGYYKDFSIVVPYPTFSTCELEIEGLT